MLESRREGYLHRIAVRRIELGFTQHEVAELCGLHVDTVRSIETRDTYREKVNLVTARALTEGLDCQLHTLFEGRELTHIGRPARTGRPLRQEDSLRLGPLCKKCYVATPFATSKCENCG